MARKRKLGRRRQRSGRLIKITAPVALDPGTPELRLKRLAILGLDGASVPLSHCNPIDILAARKLLQPDQVIMARRYQAAHATVFGASAAQAQDLTRANGGSGIDPTHRLIATASIQTWDAIIAKRHLHTRTAFRRWVIEEILDVFIVSASMRPFDQCSHACRCAIIGVGQLLIDLEAKAIPYVDRDLIDAARAQECA
jgi:hypothetical protein